MLADNAIGATFASDATYMDDSAIVGESANLGTPWKYEITGLDGRSIPHPWIDEEDEYNGPALPLHGFEF